ncbi:MAG TPA: hypothetical protein VGL83_19265 [Stellaceae bacterium]|jgi:uncharacterized protein
MLRRMKDAIYTIFAAVLGCVFGTIQAQAETFDCTHPTLPIARAVCGEPALRAADEDESTRYDTALAVTLDRSSLRAAEESWFQLEILTYNWFAQHGSSIDPAKVLEAYRQRSDELQRQAQLWRDLRHAVPAATLATSCLALPHQPPVCKVSAFFAIKGVPLLRYQLQIHQQQPTRSAVVVFASAANENDDWLPIAVAASDHATFAAPEIIASRFGRLLLIPGRSDDAAAPDASALYRFAEGTLEDIDNTSWLKTLGARLPDGLGLAPGIFPDYAKMSVIATITRSESTCCPTGGQATISLAIENDRVAVTDVSFAGPPGPASDHRN